MTLGEKIKKLRKDSGLTQEQLAEKLMVSRQAVTKWENDKGTPDIQNLRIISKLLNVSIDYLVNDSEMIDMNVIKESIDISKYSKFNKIGSRKDSVVYEKFSDAEIWPLIFSKKNTKAENIIDWFLCFFTDAGPGIPDVIHSFNHIKESYYLVNKDEKQYFVKVTDEFIETYHIINAIHDRKFEIGDMKFIKSKKKL